MARNRRSARGNSGASGTGASGSGNRGGNGVSARGKNGAKAPRPDQAERTPQPSPSTVSFLLKLSLPAAVIGVISALVLWLVDEAATVLEHSVWGLLPAALGIDPESRWWIFAVLSATGVLVGFVLWIVPGHGGRDSATVELIAPAPELRVLPSLLLVTLLTLAGGVSLGPEAPVIAINTGLLVWLFARIWPAVPRELVIMIVAAGTIGALFGTPVAAALVFTGVVGATKLLGALWDKLFLPLLAASAGSLTMLMLGAPAVSIPMPEFASPTAWHLLAAVVIAAVAAMIGIAAATVFGRVHAGFRRLGHPMLYVTLGGVLLGVLGAIGGPDSLFKGLAQMIHVVEERESFAPSTLLVLVVVKLLALVVSAAAGFRGGRIFPAVFIGAAFGVLVNAVVPGVPVSLAVGAGILGMVLAVSRDGWIALFIGVAVTGSAAAFPLLCMAVLPAWLLVSRAPEMIVHEVGEAGQEGGAGGR